MSNNTEIGDVAGSLTWAGRRHIVIENRRYYAARLAWLYVKGVWPKNQVDHLDLDRDNNAFDNLREASNQANAANKKVLRNNKLGVKGVGEVKNKYKRPDKLIHLGYFESAVTANEAYEVAAKKYFGEFARAA